LLLEHLGFAGEAERIERAAAESLQRKASTADVGGSLSTRAAGSAFREILAAS
jgi:3-isopropylmalate dehydrogenase